MRFAITSAIGWASFSNAFIAPVLPRRNQSASFSGGVSSSLLALAYDGQRRIDYVFTFDNFSLNLTYPADIYATSTLTVSFGGCSALGLA